MLQISGHRVMNEHLAIHKKNNERKIKQKLAPKQTKKIKWIFIKYNYL